MTAVDPNREGRLCRDGVRRPFRRVLVETDGFLAPLTSTRKEMAGSVLSDLQVQLRPAWVA